MIIGVLQSVFSRLQSFIIWLQKKKKTNKTEYLLILFEVRVGFCIRGLLKKDLSDYRVIVVSSKVFFSFFPLAAYIFL